MTVPKSEPTRPSRHRVKTRLVLHSGWFPLIAIQAIQQRTIFTTKDIKKVGEIPSLVLRLNFSKHSL